MNQDDALKDLSHIRSLMEKSTKFISISGWSGILAGAYTLIAVAFLVWRLKITWLVFGEVDSATQMTWLSGDNGLRIFILTGVTLLVASVATGIFMALKKAGRAGQAAWNPASRTVLLSVAAPLLTGGLLAVLALYKGDYAVLASCFLVFYGLTLYAGGHFSFKELRVLGALEILLGLLAYAYIPFGLLFFALGFGVLHILYGAIIIKKYGA
ncbi:MAG: hypothetical protein LRY55_07185 [Leadbetterella sp.]|nr:hypothetical protein [Leadbetterella sp.]